MNTNFPSIFTPLKIGNITYKNRIISAPTSLAEVGPSNTLSPENIAYYRLKAKGGAAAVTVGECVVHSPTGFSHPKMVALDTPEALPSLKDCADAIHMYDSWAGIELGHGGKQCSPAFLGGNLPVGPSEVRDENGNIAVRGMDPALMAEITDGFSKSAANCALAGFDILCVHAGHGWLLGQFLSPLSNKRTDEYGGSSENRVRYVIEVLKAVRKAAPRLVIELRISGDELTEGGYGIDEGVKLCRLLEPYVDSFHVSAGVNEDLYTSIIMHPSMFLEHGCNVYLAEAVKKAVGKPVICVGGISDPAQMEEIVASGRADLVALARALIADPDLPNKAKSGRADEIRRCLRCYACQGQMFKTRNIVCTVNPIIGREYEAEFLRPAAGKKKVAVVGGGPGGMECAYVAAMRGHDVTLFEEKDSLGGSLSFAAHIDFKGDLYRFEQYLEKMLAKYGVNIVTGTKATVELLDAGCFDNVICAVGAEAIVPPIPGMDDARVIKGTDMFDEGKQIGDKVVIIGGGLVGSEAALHLAREGRQVTVIEMLDDIAVDSTPAHRRAMKVQMSLVNNPPALHTSTKCLAILPEGVSAENRHGQNILFEADTIIVAVGMRSKAAEAESLRPVAAEYRQIGDAVKPAKVLEAVRAGYDAAVTL